MKATKFDKVWYKGGWDQKILFFEWRNFWMILCIVTTMTNNLCNLRNSDFEILFVEMLYLGIFHILDQRYGIGFFIDCEELIWTPFGFPVNYAEFYNIILVLLEFRKVKERCNINRGVAMIIYNVGFIHCSKFVRDFQSFDLVYNIA